MRPSGIAAGVAVGFVLLGTGLGSPATLLAESTNISLSQALDHYERGNREVLPAIAKIQDGVALFYNLQKVGPNWVKAKGAAQKPRRALIMAAFALEAAGGSAVSSGSAIQLIEFACDRLRPPHGPNTPLSAERLWHHAALGVLEAKGNYVAVQEHLWHLNTRFKDEPRALLARAWTKQAEWEAIPAELSAMRMRFDVIVPSDLRQQCTGLVCGPVAAAPPRPAIYGLGAGSLAGGGVAATSLFGGAGGAIPRASAAPRDVMSSIWSNPDVQVQVGTRVIKEYEKALADPAVAPEAHLRLGYLHHIAGRTLEARKHLALAYVGTNASDQLYLIELFTGWSEERAGRMDDAEIAYQRALEHVPFGRTAVTWLATLLQARGKLADAQAMIDVSLAAPSRHPDPWPLFALGDFRSFGSTMEKLRGEMWTAAR
jgi:tetratricopeptide (TPR) repeat protein